MVSGLQHVQEYVLRVLGPEAGQSMLAALSPAAVMTLVVENFVAITRKHNPNPSALQHAQMVPVVVREQQKRSKAGYSYYTGSKQHYEYGSSAVGGNNGSSNNSISSHLQHTMQLVDQLEPKVSTTTRRLLSNSGSSYSSGSYAADHHRVKQQLQVEKDLHLQFCQDFGKACTQHVRGAHTQEVRGKEPLLLSFRAPTCVVRDADEEPTPAL
jgi:hypothetical protein